MKRFVLCLLWFCLFSMPLYAAVELGLDGQTPVSIDEVYRRDGTFYLALDDILPPLGLSGQWQSVKHVYRIRTPRGTAVISPGSHFLRLGDDLTPLRQPPRFIDGRLRVSEDFLNDHLQPLLGQAIAYRNLDPSGENGNSPESALDRLFAFLLRRDKPQNAPALRAVAIDPGHGGEDPGSIAADGFKEKQVTLAVANRLEKQIKMHLGIPVTLSRDGDYTLHRSARLKALAGAEADVLLVLHAQASFDQDCHGVMLFIRPWDEGTEGTATGDGDSLRLARHLQSSLRRGGLAVGEIMRAPLLPLGRGDLPTVLVELGYLSNPADQARLAAAPGQQELALALFEGLKSYAEEKQEEKP
jgi:N-acetylmuramoyl-L-alanine amidase